MRIINQTEEKPQNILEFEIQNNLDLIVTQRPVYMNPDNKYYVKFNNSEVKGMGVLTGVTGYGNTVEDAVKDYCKRISGKTLVLDAYTNNRKEINLPDLYYEQ